MVADHPPNVSSRQRREEIRLGKCPVDSLLAPLSPLREVAAAGRLTRYHAVDCPVSSGNVGAATARLPSLLAVTRQTSPGSPALYHLGRPIYMGLHCNGQSSKANQITVTGSMVDPAVLGIHRRCWFRRAAVPGKAGSHVMDILGDPVHGAVASRLGAP